MGKGILGWLNVYEKEIRLFLWTTVLLFIVRSAGMILNNYAETAFLKRYGVEFLPIVNMINAIATVVVMGLMAGLMTRFSNTKLLIGQFLFCGLTVMGVRLLVPLGIDLIYPLLFMLKALYELLQALLFWNMANDLFNTRQSKRLFPLISAGGVLGLILSSFGTPWLARWFNFDNLLVVYLSINLAGAIVTWAMMHRFPTLLMAETKAEEKSGRSSMIQEISAIWPLLKSSVLLRVMIVLTFMPNVLIPIMNYQFNYAADSQFASEAGLVAFFGYFRGGLNIISLVILLFVGKIYGRWGLPVALMFHPFNYLLAFMAFFLRFDIFSAMYARMSTNIIRTTINIPANAVMIGLFPELFRGAVRPFLRGTVVRIALFLGSGLILISDQLFHPRYLSLVALPFLVAWIVTPFILRRKYSSILLDLIARNQLDLKALDEGAIGQLFRDRKIQEELIAAYLQAKIQDVPWYARLLQRLEVPDLGKILLQRMDALPTEHQIELLTLLPADADIQTVAALQKMATAQDARVTLACLEAANRMIPKVSALFDRRAYLDHKDPRIRATAAAGMLAQAPDTMRRTITQWLHDDDADVQKAGIIAAGISGNAIFAPFLMAKLSSSPNSDLLTETIKATHAVGVHNANATLEPFLKHDDQRVRQEALKAYHVDDKPRLKKVIELLADPNPQIREIAVDRIESAHFHDGKTLVKALNTASNVMREHLFDLLDRLQIRDLDVYRYARNQIEGAYRFLAERDGVLAMPPSPGRDLLADYLKQKSIELVDNVLRVLTIQDRTGSMRVIVRGVLSADSRQSANGVEALEDLVDRTLVKILNPLLGDASPDQVQAIARRQFKIPDYRKDLGALMVHLLQRNDGLTVLLTLQVFKSSDHHPPIDLNTLKPLTIHDNAQIRELALCVVRQPNDAPAPEEQTMDITLTLPEIILRLKKIEIFEQLSVSELAAVASVTERVSYEPGQVVINEGDPGDTLYLIIEGEVAVIKIQNDGREIELDHIGTGDHFGEMALFEDIPRTATIRTAAACRMLVLHKQEFKEMVREYPQIALEICKVLSGRIRKLHEKMTTDAPESSMAED